MRELKYYKELPVRPLNKVTYPLCLAGADCYIDIDGNKFAFISFRNASKKPFFSLYLLLKEYNSQGTLIKETKFTVPNTYGKKGLFITPEPVPIEGECEGVEVFIQLAEFTNKTFYNDFWTKRGAEKILVAPKVTSTSTVPFEVQPTKDELLKQAAEESGAVAPEVKAEEAPVAPVEEPKVEEPKVEEAAPVEEKAVPEKTASEAVVEKVEEGPLPEEKKEEPAKTEEAAAEPAAEETPDLSGNKVREIKNTNASWILPVILGVALLAAIAFVIIDHKLISESLMDYLTNNYFH